MLSSMLFLFMVTYRLPFYLDEGDPSCIIDEQKSLIYKHLTRCYYTAMKNATKKCISF